MESKYNNMYLENVLTGFSDFDNAYKVFMLLSLSGSKRSTGVCTPSPHTPVRCIYYLVDISYRGVYPTPPHTLVMSFRPQRYSERKAYKCC